VTCACCASGFRYYFDRACLRCRARHYVWVGLARNRAAESRLIRGELTEAEQAEFQRYVEEERAERERRRS